MNVLYESVTRNNDFANFIIILSVFAVIILLITVMGEIFDNGWDDLCTKLLIIITIILFSNILIVSTFAPLHRYIKVDITSITDWDTIIQKYDVSGINGKVATLIEKEKMK